MCKHTIWIFTYSLSHQRCHFLLFLHNLRWLRLRILNLHSCCCFSFLNLCLFCSFHFCYLLFDGFYQTKLIKNKAYFCQQPSLWLSLAAYWINVYNCKLTFKINHFFNLESDSELVLAYAMSLAKLAVAFCTKIYVAIPVTWLLA